MHENPYLNAENPRRSMAANAVTGKVFWFSIGAVASWVLWAISSYSLSRPQDLSRELPESIRQVAPEWMNRAKVRKIESFVFVSPGDAKQATAILYPDHGGHFPLIYLEDENGDGRVSSMSIVDASHRRVSASDDDADGTFDSYMYATGFMGDSTSFLDADMNGEYDHRFGPGPGFAVLIDSEWHDVIIKGRDRFVKIRDELTRIERVDGVWGIAK